MSQQTNTTTQQETDEQRVARESAEADRKLMELVAKAKAEEEAKAKALKEPDFGNGRYSGAMKELYQDSQRLLQLSPEHALKLAQSFGSDMGRYAPKIDFKYGRLSKDGKVTIREISKMKDLTVTNSISLMRAVQLMQEATGWGVNSYTGVRLDAQYIEWLKK